MSPHIFALTTVLALGITPQEDVAREAVDLIELNHFYDEHGRLVFDQVIFYDWSKDDARYMVRAWRLVKNPAQLPQRDWKGDGYLAALINFRYIANALWSTDEAVDQM